MKKVLILAVGLLTTLLGFSSALYAGDIAPWGSAQELDIDYKPNKVLYDLTSGSKADIVSVLDRIGYLYKLYQSDSFDSSIVVVIHGDSIPFFTIKELKKHRDMMRRAQSLTVGTSIEFRMCRAAAKLMHYEAKDIHGFISMVPMADAEITRLQSQNYAYMR